jgi:BioY family
MSVRAVAATMADTVLPQTRSLRWEILLVVAFSTLMAVFAQISISLPFTPVPITGQPFGVLLIGALLGRRRGALAMLVYLAKAWPDCQSLLAPPAHGAYRASEFQ